MNAENPVQIDLYGVSATGTKDTGLAEHIGGSVLAKSGSTGGPLLRRTADRVRTWGRGPAVQRDQRRGRGGRAVRSA
jgi:hypothetical protein